MSGMQPATHDGATAGSNGQRPAFHVFDDLRSLEDSENAWADLFACMQQPGEAVHDYGTRVIRLAHQIVDLDPAVYECLVFHRVKAGLRKPLRDMLLLNTVQPNSHAMLDNVVMAIERKLQTNDPASGIDTPSLTPTPNWTNAQQSQHNDNHVPAIQSSQGPFANAASFNGHQQEQSWQHGTASQQHPHENGTRTTQASPFTNHSDHGAFQIRGAHQMRAPTTAPEHHQQASPTPHEAEQHYSPPSNPNGLGAPMLGRHEVQHNAGPFQGTKRPGSDNGVFQNDANDQLSRKKIPWQDYQRKKMGPTLKCHYCKEAGHVKDTCPKNPRNMG
ncbi:MAG: hypothetical protein Q9168_004172 [Polycauliona sp. 1 TL-2023]